MKNIFRSLLVVFALVVAGTAYGAPTVNITVKQKAGGKTVKQVKTDSSGNFTIGSLPPGAYSFEFRAGKAADVKNKQFSVAVDGIKKSGTQNISGADLADGVAVNVEVAPGGTGVTGQIVSGSNTASQKKEMVWIPPMLGSLQRGHWAEKGSAEEIASRTRGRARKESIQNLQEKSYNPQGN